MFCIENPGADWTLLRIPFIDLSHIALYSKSFHFIFTQTKDVFYTLKR